jgi:ACR3 family arsenite efflux pump ArsB/nucleotide-binding universal stress UspA family protein
MWKFLVGINRNLIVAIPTMMVLGFVFGILVEPSSLKNLIVPFTFLMVYPMMVTLKIKKVFEGGDVRAQILTQLINFAIVPFVAYGLGVYFFKDQPYMALGLLLAGLVPTSGMTISWTGFAKGNVEAAVKMTVIGLTLGSIATPFYVKGLMGATIAVNMAAVMQQIVIIVLIPMLAGFLTQQGLVKKYGLKGFQEQWAPRFPAMSTIGVLGIVFVAIALKARAVAAAPDLLLMILIPLAIIYLINYILSTLTGKLLLPRGDAIALVYGSVMRNLSIALAIAINAFGAEGSSAALVIAIAYIIQVQSAAWYVKFTDRIFGPPKPKAPPLTQEIPEGKKPVAPPTAESVVPSGVLPILAGITGAVPLFRKILYATDLSETARYAIGYACSIGQCYQAPVSVLHVVPDILEAFSEGAGINLTGHLEAASWQEYNKKAIDSAVSAVHTRIRETVAKAGKDMTFKALSEEDIHIRVGHPVNEIVAMAHDGDYDLVVLGTHGHGKLENIMIGSVATGVIRQCHKPVLVIRLPQ